MTFTQCECCGQTRNTDHDGHDLSPTLLGGIYLTVLAVGFLAGLLIGGLL